MLHKLHNYGTTSFGREVIKTDANSEKYSLRQRQRGRNQGENNNSTFSQIRSRSNRSRLETSTPTCNKSKTKTAPLSKYRRKTANARERSRMREINLAFESLRQCVPASIAGKDVGHISEKLTKITTLRLAMQYIHKLTEALTDPNFDVDFLFEPKQADNTCGDDLAEKRKVFKQISSTNDSKTSNTKTLNKRKISRQCRKPEAQHHIMLANSTQITKSMNSSIFDSDGESLHLSESCLSPINDICDNLKKLSDGPCDSNHNSFNRVNWNEYSEATTLRNPLEISFCLLDQTNESIEWENVQHRNSCSSPFPVLDTFSSLNEFLHQDLTDHNSLDLFLT